MGRGEEWKSLPVGNNSNYRRRVCNTFILDSVTFLFKSFFVILFILFISAERSNPVAVA